MRWRSAIVVLAIAATAVLGGGGVVAAAPSLPGDPFASGTIGLCNRAGQPVTSGNTDDKPIVWRAVGSKRAPSPYDGDGAFATLYAFQPRPGVTADQWSGDTLTASSAYTNKAHPMAQATQLDFTLNDLLAEYPTKQDGLLQLRLYYSAATTGPDTSSYAATFIQVTGTRWAVVQDTGSFSCTDGSAVSSEVDAGIVDKDGNAVGTAAASLSASAAAASSAPAPPTAGAAPVPGGSAATPTPSGSADASRAGDLAARSDTRRGGTAVTWIVILAVVVVGLAAGGGTWWWRRRPAPPTVD